MKIKFILLLSIFIALFSCKDNKELLIKEKELIQKEKELVEKEKELLKIRTLELESENLKLKDSLNSKAEILKNGYPTLNYIKKSLIGKSAKGWNFAALSEFKEMKFEKEIKDGNFYEAIVDIDLEDYSNGKYYYMKLFVSYRKVDSNWNLTKYDPIEYKRR